MDLFCTGRQSLLYNLFDAVQMCTLGHPLMVIGTSVRQDVVDLLEKRVKSRFSQRCIWFHSLHNFDEYLKVAKTKLLERFYGVNSEQVDEALHQASVRKVLRKCFDLDGSVSHLDRLSAQAWVLLQTKQEETLSQSLYEAYNMLYADMKSRQLRDLSVLELCLMIAMTKLQQASVHEFNYCMVYAEYAQFAVTQSIAVKKPVAYQAFRNLMMYEWVKPVASVIKCPDEYVMMRLVVEEQQVKDAVMKSNDLGYAVKRWCTAC
jgi:origin recognition complex subunit 4